MKTLTAKLKSCQLELEEVWDDCYVNEVSIIGYSQFVQISVWPERRKIWTDSVPPHCSAQECKQGDELKVEFRWWISHWMSLQAQLRNEKADAAISKLQDNIKFLQSSSTQNLSKFLGAFCSSPFFFSFQMNWLSSEWDTLPTKLDFQNIFESFHAGRCLC